MSSKKSSSKFPEKIKNLKKTPKGKAILKLIYWTIFFIIIIIFCLIASFISEDNLAKPKEETKPSIEEPIKPEEENLPSEILTLDTYLTAKNKLISNEYTYKYEIVIDNIKYIYNGTKNTLTDTGYKESPTGTLKYVIDSTGVYSETTMGRTPITNLYENIDSTYLDLSYLESLISTLEFKLNPSNINNNYLYESIKDNITYQIEFENTTYNLKLITIQGPNYQYTLTYN